MNKNEFLQKRGAVLFPVIGTEWPLPYASAVTVFSFVFKMPYLYVEYMEYLQVI